MYRVPGILQDHYHAV